MANSWEFVLKIKTYIVTNYHQLLDFDRLHEWKELILVELVQFARRAMFSIFLCDFCVENNLLNLLNPWLFFGAGKFFC